MSFSYIAGNAKNNDASGTGLSTGSTLNIAAGDLLVVGIGWYGGISTITVSDGGSNNFTIEPTTINSVYGCFGYVLSATANASATFTATWGTARTWRNILVMQFRPDSGETVTKDTSNTGTGTSTAAVSGNITTTGTDEVVIGHAYNLAIASMSSLQIGDTVADGTLTSAPSRSHLWYRLLTATASNIHSQGTINTSTDWFCDIISFKSTLDQSSSSSESSSSTSSASSGSSSSESSSKSSSSSISSSAYSSSSSESSSISSISSSSSSSESSSSESSSSSSESSSSSSSESSSSESSSSSSESSSSSSSESSSSESSSSSSESLSSSQSSSSSSESSISSSESSSSSSESSSHSKSSSASSASSSSSLSSASSSASSSSSVSSSQSSASSSASSSESSGSSSSSSESSVDSRSSSVSSGSSSSSSISSGSSSSSSASSESSSSSSVSSESSSSSSVSSGSSSSSSVSSESSSSRTLILTTDLWGATFAPGSSSSSSKSSSHSSRSSSHSSRSSFISSSSSESSSSSYSSSSSSESSESSPTIPSSSSVSSSKSSSSSSASSSSSSGSSSFSSASGSSSSTSSSESSSSASSSSSSADTFQVVVDSEYKEPYWLFEVKAATLATDNWSTLATTYDGDSYIFKILPKTFKGITLNRPQSELSIQAPNDLYFEVSNDDSILSADDYIDSQVTLRLVVSDGTNIHNLRTWKFNTTFCEAVYQKLRFTCEDFVQRHLRGDYPKSRTISTIFPSDDPDIKHIEDTLCPPIPFGTAYVPVRSIKNGYIDRDYLLGELISSNLVINGSFETGDPPDDWTAFNSANLDRHADPNTGTYCLEINDGGVNSPLTYQQISIEANESYVFSYYVKQGTGIAYRVHVWDSVDLLVDYSGTATTNYVKGSFTFSTTQTIIWIYLTHSISGGAGTNILFDDVNLRKLDYVISECRSPRGWGLKSVWQSPQFSFPQYIVTDQTDIEWQTFDAIINDSDDDGTVDANGLWLSGDFFLDMPLKFTRSDLITTTNPANIIEWVLEDMGIPSADIDSGDWTCSFNHAAEIFNSWGLELNGAFYYKETREKVLAKLLNMCHATLRVTDKVELHVLSAASQATIDNTNVLRNTEIGEGTFRYNMVTPSEDDSGLIAYQIYGDSHDELIKMSVPAKATQNSVSSNVLEMPFVSNATHALHLGSLYYQRQLLRKANVNFTTSSKLIMRNPDQVMSIDHADYGGTYDVLIDRMTIGKDLSIGFDAFSTTATLDDWLDLSFTSMTVYEDDTTSYWAPVISGPNTTVSSGWIPNMLPGKVRIGNTGDVSTYIELDPAEPLQKFVENDVTRLEIGDLDTDNYGIRINDYQGNIVLQVDGNSSAAITNMIINDLLEGTEISMQGWQLDCTFSESDTDIVIWTSGTLSLSTGTEYDIIAGTTGNMIGPVFIYVDLNTSTTELQISATGGDAVGAFKLLVAVAQPGDDNPTFQVFGGKGGLLIGADQLAVNAITANHISAGLIQGDMIDGKVITADHLSVTDLGAVTITAGTFQTALTGKRIIIDPSGIKLRLTDSIGMWGDGGKWGDGTEYGSGDLAYIAHTSEDVPFHISAEQTNYGDFRFYPRTSEPAGANDVGTVACVDDDLMIFNGATWATVGHTLA